MIYNKFALCTESKTTDSESKATQTIAHINQFGHKLQRRLTFRIIAYAKKLRDNTTWLLHFGYSVSIYLLLKFNF